MRIDALVPDPRRKGCVRMMVAGRTAWTVPGRVVTELGLQVGSLPGAVAVARLEAAALEEAALRAGLRMLENRAHGRQELLRKLEFKGHPAPAAVSAIAALDAMGLLDDRAFATAYVGSRAGRGRGPERICRDLAALGVEPQIARAAIVALAHDGEVDPWPLAVARATRRALGLRHLPRLVQQRRLTAYFVRRGFAGLEVRRTVLELLGEGATAGRD